MSTSSGGKWRWLVTALLVVPSVRAEIIELFLRDVPRKRYLGIGAIMYSDAQRINGSWQSDGTNLAEFFLEPEPIFGRSLLVGDLLAVDWHTFKPSTNGPDWFVEIYTKPVDPVTDDAAEYGRRLTVSATAIGATPDAPGGQWNKSTTAATAGDGNQAVVFDRHRTQVGFPGAPAWEAILAGAVEWGAYLESGSTEVVDYRDLEVLYIAFVFGSDFEAGFQANLDWLVFSLAGEPELIVLDLAIPEPASAAWLLAGLLACWRRRR